MASPPFGFLWGALSNFLSSYSKSSRTTNNYTPFFDTPSLPLARRVTPKIHFVLPYLILLCFLSNAGVACPRRPRALHSCLPRYRLGPSTQTELPRRHAFFCLSSLLYFAVIPTIPPIFSALCRQGRSSRYRAPSLSLSFATEDTPYEKQMDSEMERELHARDSV